MFQLCDNQCSSTVRASVFPQYLFHLSLRISTGAGAEARDKGGSLGVTWCEEGRGRGYGAPSRDQYSTCRGVTRIKVPLTPMGPMGRVALYPNAPASPPSPLHSQASKKLSIATEKQVWSSACVCVCVCTGVHVSVCFEPPIFQHCSWAAIFWLLPQ